MYLQIEENNFGYIKFNKRKHNNFLFAALNVSEVRYPLSFCLLKCLHNCVFDNSVNLATAFSWSPLFFLSVTFFSKLFNSESGDIWLVPFYPVTLHHILGNTVFPKHFLVKTHFHFLTWDSVSSLCLLCIPATSICWGTILWALFCADMK